MLTITKKQELFCPFQPSISPYVQSVENHTLQWCETFQLYPGAMFNELKTSNFGYMTCRFYPTASHERLCITNDLLVLLFLLDDLFDHQDAVAQDPAALKMLMKNFLGVLTEDKHFTMENGGNVLAALSDVWQRMKACSSAAFQREFVQDILLLFNAIEWQNKNANSWKTPSISEYIERRPIIGGAHIAGRLIYFAEDIALPASIKDHPTLQRLNELCGHLGCWANDLFSLSKEIAHGDTHNLVMVIRQEKHLELDDAIHETVMLHNEEMREFHELYNSMEDFPAGARKYAYDLAMILRGNMDWSFEDTARYEFNCVENYTITDRLTETV